MIKINLATRKQSEIVAGAKGTNSSGVFGKIDLDQFKELPIRKVALPLIVGFFASYMLDSYKVDELKKFDDIILKLNTDTSRIDKDMEKLKSFDQIKKQLDEDEVTIKTKLETINKLILDRADPPNLLISVAKAIPKEVWLSEFRIEKSEVTMRGESLGFNQISDFMKNLNDNTYLLNVDLKNTQQKINHGLELATFELKAKRR